MTATYGCKSLDYKNRTVLLYIYSCTIVSATDPAMQTNLHFSKSLLKIEHDEIHFFRFEIQFLSIYSVREDTFKSHKFIVPERNGINTEVNFQCILNDVINYRNQSFQQRGLPSLLLIQVGQTSYI